MLYLGRHIAGLNAATKVTVPPAPVDSSKPVLFRDYDGKVLYSYTPEEIASMSQLPPLPTSPGLSCQEWNWTLPQIKSYVATYGKCEIGATYTTDDGKTRIKLTIQDPKYSNIPIAFQQSVANGVKVNWGDGSADQTYSSTSQQTITHQYSPLSYPQTYTITFEVVNGTMSFPNRIMGTSGSESSSNPISAWVSMIDEVNIGNSVTSIGNYAFQQCLSLASVTIPSSVTSIGTGMFQQCLSLAFMTIPSLVTSVGNNAFRTCYSLASVAIPCSVTDIQQYAFAYCYSLASVTIPSSVTSIGNNAFNGCSGLTNITIPNSVTSIYTQMFQGCYGLKTFDFHTHSSVPTLANVNAFTNTPTSKEIIVPDALYEDWIAASNWSSTTNNIVGSIVKYSESSIYGG